ncbi:UNVERIFIED_CONTAM: hypothetical protein K2H54_007725 [Gekko kuhli]
MLKSLQLAAVKQLLGQESSPLKLKSSTCEFSDIVELLLKFGADPTIRDTEGYLPEEVTDCRAITFMLQKHSAGKA